MLQREAANELGVSETLEWLWENERQQPHVHRIPQLIRFLGYCPWEPHPPARTDLVTIREALGLTRLDVERLLGVGKGVVSRWESGQRRPPAHYRQALLRLVPGL